MHSYVIYYIKLCWNKSYSGKLIDENFKYDSLLNKTQVTSKLGQPNFIDPIENKFYYFSEQKNTKNFFNQKIINRKMIVLNFDEEHCDLTNSDEKRWELMKII